jgi:hypothetical protein
MMARGTVKTTQKSIHSQKEGTTCCVYFRTIKEKTNNTPMSEKFGRQI